MTILPVYDMITVPDSTVFFRTELYEKLTGREPEKDEKIIVIVAKRETTVAELDADSVYPVTASTWT